MPSFHVVQASCCLFLSSTHSLLPRLQLPPRAMSPARTTGLSSGTECPPTRWAWPPGVPQHLPLIVQPRAHQPPSPNPSPVPTPVMRVLSCPRRDPGVTLASLPHPPHVSCQLSSQYLLPVCLLCPVLVTLPSPTPSVLSPGPSQWPQCLLS